MTVFWPLPSTIKYVMRVKGHHSIIEQHRHLVLDWNHHQSRFPMAWTSADPVLSLAYLYTISMAVISCWPCLTSHWPWFCWLATAPATNHSMVLSRKKVWDGMLFFARNNPMVRQYSSLVANLENCWDKFLGMNKEQIENFNVQNAL
jgi:hypothetical protein